MDSMMGGCPCEVTDVTARAQNQLGADVPGMISNIGTALTTRATAAYNDAVQWIVTNLARIRRIPYTLQQNQLRVSRLASVGARMNPTQVAQVQKANSLLGEIKSKANGVVSAANELVARIASYLPKDSGLGILPAIPLWLIATLGATAVTVFAGAKFIFSREDQVEALLSAVERGVLTPEEAGKLAAGQSTGFLANLGKSVGVGTVLIGAAIALYVFGLPKSRRA